jgi:hypothetical protein
MKTADDFITEIFATTRPLSDEKYCEYLEEISSALDDAAKIKREEMAHQGEDE